MRNNLLLVASVVLLAFSITHVQASDCQPVNVSYLQSGLGDMNSDGIWVWDSHNYVKARVQGGGVGLLCTPELDLSGVDAVSLSFEHTHNYANNPSEDYTLRVTDNYLGTYEASQWTQLPITQYATNSDWNFVNATITVPLSDVGEKTVFCFRYTSTAEKNGTWELRNLHIVATCEGKVAPPVDLPDVGSGRLKVFVQNLQNYYITYNTGRGNYTREEFAEKTHKIMDAMLWADADIYAFCELEAQDIILRQLVDSINKQANITNYVYVADGINEAWDEQYNNNLKSGFIYRKDKVKTIGSSTGAYYSGYYSRTMRIQTFEELSTGEQFTLSMNHFKSKAGGAEDQGNSQRVTNATTLINNLPGKAMDEDILIVGDLNCEVGEEPLNLIENAGYVEQLLKYDANAYSYCYQGNGSLIDHVYANATMAAQITGAGVFHISSTCELANADYRYSDHDPYMVGINLGSHPTGCEQATATRTAIKRMQNGQLIIVRPDGTRYNVIGLRVE